MPSSQSILQSSNAKGFNKSKEWQLQVKSSTKSYHNSVEIDVQKDPETVSDRSVQGSPAVVVAGLARCCEPNLFAGASCFCQPPGLPQGITRPHVAKTT